MNIIEMLDKEIEKLTKMKEIYIGLVPEEELKITENQHYIRGPQVRTSSSVRNNIKELRAAGKSLSAIAAATNVSCSTVSRILSDKMSNIKPVGFNSSLQEQIGFVMKSGNIMSPSEITESIPNFRGHPSTIGKALMSLMSRNLVIKEGNGRYRLAPLPEAVESEFNFDTLLPTEPTDV